MRMRSMLIVLSGLAAALLAASSVNAQQTVKIGLIMPYSGQFADTATQMDNAIKLYMKQKGDAVAGKKIEIIRKDTGGVAPDVAKRLAQELVVRDKVDLLAGFILTPNALAAGDVSAEAKKFMVVMNAATAIITTKSAYMVRTSVTVPQLNETFGTWAYKSGIRKVYTMVSDYGPGHDAEQGFHRGFKDAGGEITGSVRFPVATPDFSAFVQRAKDLNPEAIYVWVPGGVQPAAIGKALAERGIDPRKTKILGQGELTEDEARKSMGDASIGIITVYHYDHNHDSALNREFVKAFNEAYGGRNPNIYAIGDGTITLPAGWRTVLIQDFVNNLGIVLWTSVILTVFLDVFVDEAEKQSVARLKALEKALTAQGYRLEPVEIKDEAAVTAAKLDALMAKVDALQAEVAALREGKTTSS